MFSRFVTIAIDFAVGSAGVAAGSGIYDAIRPFVVHLIVEPVEKALFGEDAVDDEVDKMLENERKEAQNGS
jgi:hypothetical protein